MTLLFSDRPDDVARVRDCLAEAGFTAAGVAGVVGPNGLGYLAQGELAPVLRRTRDGSALETLIRLFLCGVPVERRAAQRALGPLSLDAWAGAEMLRADGDTVSALVTLQPVAADDAEWIVPSDATRADERDADYVVGVGPASHTLAGVTIRSDVNRCLDLGTGSGIQALHAQRHANRVVATDRNPRAVAFAEFAMRLNRVGNVEVRAGDLFEPVEAETFDLIVSNPPFVISPESRLIYRDSGLAGDELCRRVVTEAPIYLSEGGFCQLLANWAHFRDTAWQDRLGEWISGLGCDAWIVQTRVEDAETYASTWIRQEEPDPSNASARFDEWMDHYERAGIEAIGFGVITLRRTARARPWLCLEELAREFVLPCGNEIAAAFDRAVWLAEHPADRDLLDARLVIHYDVVRRDTSYGADAQWHVDDSLVELHHGLHYANVVDALGADFVAGCDGNTPVADLITRMAHSIGLEATDIAPQTLGFARRLIQQGIVRPLS